MLTGAAAGYGSLSASSFSRQKRSPYSYYVELTQLSGGFVVPLTDRNNVPRATELIRVRVRVAQVGRNWSSRLLFVY